MLHGEAVTNSPNLNQAFEKHPEQPKVKLSKTKNKDPKETKNNTESDTDELLLGQILVRLL